MSDFAEKRLHLRNLLNEKLKAFAIIRDFGDLVFTVGKDSDVLDRCAFLLPIWAIVAPDGQEQGAIEIFNLTLSLLEDEITETRNALVALDSEEL